MTRSRLLSLSLLISSVLILLLPALQPLLSSDMTCGYDNAFHLWRAVETEHLLKEGLLFSRWAPDMAHGFGYPLFNFSAALSAYGPALLHLLDVPWGWALNLTFAAGWVLAALAMAGFVTDLFDDRWAGVAAAALYTYVPFHAYDVFQRGSLSQAGAWLFPPLVLWALRRADRRGGFAITAVGTAGLLLTHNVFALLFVPLCFAYLWAVAKERARGVALRGAAALLLGLGLSAFFWLPALSELSYVRSEQLSGAWVFDFANNFLPLDQLFALPRTADPTWINDWPARGLGLVPFLVALGGLLALRERSRRWTVALFALGLGSSLFLVLPVSRPVWDALPLLQRVQFPWRLVGPAALCAAILAGAAVYTLRASRWSGVVALSLLVILPLANTGWLYPRHCTMPGDVSVAGMIDWERQTDTLGTTASREFLPMWVEQMPHSAFLQAAYDAGGPILRFDPADLPAGAHILEARLRGLETVVDIDTPTPFQARYLAFYYPGWRAWINGTPVDVTPSDPEGLVTFDVPAGRHTLTVRFVETPARLAADAISLLSLFLLLLCAFAPLPPCSPAPLPSSCQERPPHARPLAILLTVSLAVVLLKVGLIDRVENPLRRSNLVDGRLQRVDVPADVTFDGQFRLLATDALPTSVAGDEAIQVTTYWQDVLPGGPAYWVDLRLEDAQGMVWSVPELRPPRWHREPPAAPLWAPDEYASVAAVLQPLPGIPPGDYTVVLGVFDRDTLTPFSAPGVGLALPLGQVTVVPPRQTPTVDDLAPQQTAAASFGPLRLLGYNLDRVEAAPGDPFFLTLFWQADRPPAHDVTFRLRLLDPQGRDAAAFDLPPAHDFPTGEWAAGDVWRGQHLLRLPAGLESGVHRWEIGLPGDNSVPFELGELAVHAPERLFESPPLDVETGARLGDVATLLGAQLDPATCNPQSPLTVTLVWRSEAETAISYRVFLHLLGPDGAAVAQSDGEPAGWSRPTTGWLPGEVVLDQRVLTLPVDLPPGEYRLQAGLYTLEGGRLTTPEGEGLVLLAPFVVGEVP
ncbi:MAG: YfhO family protein [Anaerolineae bacterium]|nr:YfhO family protein [Anaerolineae bacterium]